MATKKKTAGAAKPRTRRAAGAGPKPKHVTIEPGQRLFVHVAKGTKAVSEYIAGADGDGVVRMNQAPEQAPPVMDPNPISGT